ncbi:MAG: hypothetical protein NWE90_06425 [Candidatus Bathyarchaeota archaeon]|nr:hypothetical protein [Candidatus Bathyarchaeota archaeon]
MPKLTKNDWERLREEFNVAFSGMNPHLFALLLDKIYSGNPEDPDEIDDIDALMIYLAHAEPPIPPGGKR